MSHSPASIYIVDDETAIADAVSFALRTEGFRCQHFATGTDFLAGVRREVPLLVLLDVGLPDGSGFDFFRQLRDVSHAPVIFLTARKEEIDRVVGLEMGADDYVVKPFSVRELVARVRTVLRRGANHTGLRPAQPAAPVPPMTQGRFRQDSVRRQISYCGKPLDLTLHEYQLLEVLLQHPGRVFTRAQLLDHAWEAPDHRLDRTVDSHIKSVRAKLREVDSSGDPIRTHRGMGYSLDPDA